MAAPLHREGICLFPPEHPLFAEHFSAAPRVPGTLIMEAMRAEAARHFPHWRVIGLHRFRFHSFVIPGQYTFSLTLHTETARMRCELYSGAQRLAEGTLLMTQIPGSVTA